MTLTVLTEAVAAFVVIRAIAYGIYCFKNTGRLGGISVLLLAAAALAAGITAMSNVINLKG
ncbi:MAG: hypothetical protein IJH37_04830 [Clostridia bacterium]|nr:hypothetical protein [Clostridia bacterium]